MLPVICLLHFIIVLLLRHVGVLRDVGHILIEEAFKWLVVPRLLVCREVDVQGRSVREVLLVMLDGLVLV